MFRNGITNQRDCQHYNYVVYRNNKQRQILWSNKNCTSTLKVTKHLDETITVDACVTHYGHSKDLQHTWISKLARITYH